MACQSPLLLHLDDDSDAVTYIECTSEEELRMQNPDGTWKTILLRDTTNDQVHIDIEDDAPTSVYCGTDGDQTPAHNGDLSDAQELLIMHQYRQDVERVRSLRSTVYYQCFHWSPLYLPNPFEIQVPSNHPDVERKYLPKEIGAKKNTYYYPLPLQYTGDC